MYLLITRTDWDEPPRARHQLAAALAKEGRVCFVSLNRFGRPGIRTRRTSEGIEVIEPSWFVGGKYLYRLPIMNELYQLWLLPKLVRRYRGSRVITFDPSGALIPLFFAEYVYFCNDDFLDLKRSKSLLVRRYFKATQKEVAKKAKHNVGVSKYLVDRLKSYNKSSSLILTGASVVFGNSEYAEAKPNRLVLIYVGWLSKIDCSWIIEAAKIPGIEIQLVGPYKKQEIAELEELESVKILGVKTGMELHNYLNGADIGLAPYLKGRDTEEVYTVPNKFWLYLSHGLPIVSQEIKNLHQFPDRFVYQAKSAFDFVTKIKMARDQNNPLLYRERLAYIRRNSWQDRAKQIINFFELNENRED